MGGHKRYLLSWKRKSSRPGTWNYDLLTEVFIVKFKLPLLNFYFEALKVMAAMREEARVTISPSVAIETTDMAAGSRLWLGEQKWGLSHLSFNLSVLVCFGKRKNCFIELSPDMSQSTVYAASYLQELPPVSIWVGCFPASHSFAFFP